MDKAKQILKTAARYTLDGIAKALALIARGATWMATKARELGIKL